MCSWKRTAVVAAVMVMTITAFAAGFSLGKDGPLDVDEDVLQMAESMSLARAATFPKGTDDSEEGTVYSDFLIARTEVTYGIWYAVREWAEGNGYTFANPGREGSTGQIGGEPSEQKDEPVTRVSFRDALVWCNALSELLGHDPVYTHKGYVVRDATDGEACDNAVQGSGNGFRLPTSDEWELAARYRGRDAGAGALEYPSDSGKYWTRGNYASGATGEAFRVTDEIATGRVAWYIQNSGGRTNSVAQLEPNALQLYDMSGNVWEWCFTSRDSNRVVRGGSFDSVGRLVQLGLVLSFRTTLADDIRGFRVVRNP